MIEDLVAPILPVLDKLDAPEGPQYEVEGISLANRRELTKSLLRKAIDATGLKQPAQPKQAVFAPKNFSLSMPPAKPPTGPGPLKPPPIPKPGVMSPSPIAPSVTPGATATTVGVPAGSTTSSGTTKMSAPGIKPPTPVKPPPPIKPPAPPSLAPIRPPKPKKAPATEVAGAVQGPTLTKGPQLRHPGQQGGRDPVGAINKFLKSGALDDFRPRVEVFLFNDKGQVLAGSTPGRDGFKFPGGGIDGDPVDHAARKELREEAGYKVKHLQSVGLRPDKREWSQATRDGVLKATGGKRDFGGDVTHWRMGVHSGRDTSVLGSEGDALARAQFRDVPKVLESLREQTKDPDAFIAGRSQVRHDALAAAHQRYQNKFAMGPGAAALLAAGGGAAVGAGALGAGYLAAQRLPAFLPGVEDKAVEFAALKDEMDPLERLTGYSSRGAELMGAPLMRRHDGSMVSGRNFVRAVRSSAPAAAVGRAKGVHAWDESKAEHYNQFRRGPANALLVLAKEEFGKGENYDYLAQALQGTRNGDVQAQAAAVEALRHSEDPEVKRIAAELMPRLERNLTSWGTGIQVGRTYEKARKFVQGEKEAAPRGMDLTHSYQTAKDRDKALWDAYKADPSPMNLKAVMDSLSPAIESEIARWSGQVPVTVMRLEARKLAVEAIKSYDPNMGTALSTHVLNKLKRLSRTVYSHQDLVRMPENRKLENNALHKGRVQLLDELGRDPTTAELSDHLGWSGAKVTKVQAFQVSEYVESQDVGGDMFGNVAGGATSDPRVAFVYNDLSPVHQTIFEHTTGYGGKSILTARDIAAKTGLKEHQVAYQRRKITDKFQDVLR